LARFSRFWLGFFWFGLVCSVFPVWLGLARFFLVFLGFGSVWFFQFFAYKTKPAGFFKILIDFLFRFGFFGYFFSGFLGLIAFLVFLLTPNSYKVCGRESSSCLYI
jgi:hypothetical protein